MNDLSSTPTEGNSTVLDPNTGSEASGGGQPKTLEPEAPESVRDSIAAVVKETSKEPEQDADDAKTPDPDKAEKEAKAEKAEADGKGEKAAEKADKEVVKDEKQPETDTKQAEKPEGEGDDKAAAKAKDDKSAKHPEPPRNFLPDAKEVWRNVPRAVQRDIETMTKAHEEEVTKLREANERYESIRPYDELARSNGRELKESLQRVNQIENIIQANPIAGLNAVLMEIGPRKSDGQPFSLFEVADYISKLGPEGYQQLMSAPQQQMQQPQQQPNQQTQVLMQQVEELQSQQVFSQVIEPFAKENPRYYELENDIAFFLDSDKVPKSLSPQDRLAAAYDMAVRINPASQGADQTDPDPDAQRRADNLSGTKSIKSAPGSVTPDLEPDRGGSIRDVLTQEFKRVGRS